MRRSPFQYTGFHNCSYPATQKKYNDAIHMLDSAYLSYPQYSRNAGILAYSLASAYQGKGDSKNAIKYFAISAISDAISGTRENRSLRILAKLILRVET